MNKRSLYVQNRGDDAVLRGMYQVPMSVLLTPHVVRGIQTVKETADNFTIWRKSETFLLYLQQIRYWNDALLSQETNRIRQLEPKIELLYNDFVKNLLRKLTGNSNASVEALKGSQYMKLKDYIHHVYVDIADRIIHVKGSLTHLHDYARLAAEGQLMRVIAIDKIEQIMFQFSSDNNNNSNNLLSAVETSPPPPRNKKQKAPTIQQEDLSERNVNANDLSSLLQSRASGLKQFTEKCITNRRNEVLNGMEEEVDDIIKLNPAMLEKSHDTILNMTEIDDTMTNNTYSIAVSKQNPQLPQRQPGFELFASKTEKTQQKEMTEKTSITKHGKQQKEPPSVLQEESVILSEKSQRTQTVPVLPDCTNEISVKSVRNVQQQQQKQEREDSSVMNFRVAVIGDMEDKSHDTILNLTEAEVEPQTTQVTLKMDTEMTQKNKASYKEDMSEIVVSSPKNMIYERPSAANETLLATLAKKPALTNTSSNDKLKELSVAIRDDFEKSLR